MEQDLEILDVSFRKIASEVVKAYKRLEKAPGNKKIRINGSTYWKEEVQCNVGTQTILVCMDRTGYIYNYWTLIF